MRVLVYPHAMEMGGSQLNAVELAAGVRDLGHDVVVFGRSGPLLSRVAELGLEWLEAPPPGRRPSPSTARVLAGIASRRGIDVVHGYEWPPVLDAVLAAHRCSAVTVGTVMSMSVAPFIPRDVPLVVGTEQISAVERRRAFVRTIEPPVDLNENDVDQDPGRDRFRERLGIGPDEIAIVAVARLSHELKLEGTLAAIRTVGRLARMLPVRLVIVGGGPAREEVESAAAEANEGVDVPPVIVAGEVSDPRPAYAAADISLGMGGSALRALAYRRPLVVQGEQGFWRTLSPSTLDQFLWTGWYGVGDGVASGDAKLESELAPLLADSDLRARLGDFGLSTVRSRFSLERAARVQADMYTQALEHRTPAAARLGSELGALVRYSGYFAAKRFRRLRGREQRDDFNARPVAAQRSTRAR